MISFKLAIRTLKRFRLYTFINAASLVLSLVCIFSLSRYIYRECTIDMDLPGHDRVFITVFDQYFDKKAQAPSPTIIFHAPQFANPQSRMEKQLYENEKVVHKTIVSGPNITDAPQLQEGKERLEPLKVLYTDSVFFKMMPFKLLHGSLALRGENDALIMSDVAERIFGTTDVIGRTWMSEENTKKTVTGVIQRPHCKTTFCFDLVYNIRGTKNPINSRGLVQLSEASDSIYFNQVMNDDFIESCRLVDNQSNFSVSVRLHLLSLNAFNRLFGENVRTFNLYLVMVVVFLIIGVFNYLNLHSVIMQRRKRDIQIKTIFGANRKNIFRELFMEHFLILTGTLPIIWLLVYLTRNQLSEIFNIPIESDLRFDIGFTIAIPLVLGLFFSIVSFIQIHRQAHESSTASTVPAARRSSYARIAFLFVQYMITFCLIVFALYLNHNVFHLFYSDRGYRSENILQFNINTGLAQHIYFFSGTDRHTFPHHDRLKELVPEIKRAISHSPLFEGVTLGERPYDRFPDNEFILGNGKVVKASSHHATKEWMEFFQLRFLHGRNWNDIESTQVGGGINDDVPRTPDRTYKVIVNESLWKQLTPAEQKRPFTMNVSGGFKDSIRVKIIGIIKDFHLWKLSDKVDPLIFYLEGQQGYIGKTIFTAVKPGKEKEAVAYLKRLHERLCPGRDFTYKWMNDDLMDRHKEDFQAVLSVSLFALIAIFISCLGLFGISLYDIRGRYREIALRKINGAHNKDIYRILFHKYVITLLAAAILSAPFAYYGVTTYMEKVDNRAPLTPWIFIGALLILALVSILTLILQIRRAVHLNPAEVMKTE